MAFGRGLRKQKCRSPFPPLISRHSIYFRQALIPHVMLFAYHSLLDWDLFYCQPISVTFRYQRCTKQYEKVIKSFESLTDKNIRQLPSSSIAKSTSSLIRIYGCLPLRKKLNNRSLPVDHRGQRTQPYIPVTSPELSYTMRGSPVFHCFL